MNFQVNQIAGLRSFSFSSELSSEISSENLPYFQVSLSRWIWSGLMGKELRRACCSPVPRCRKSTDRTRASLRPSMHEVSLCGSLPRLRCHVCAVLVCGWAADPPPPTHTTLPPPRAPRPFSLSFSSETLNFQVKLSSETRK